MNESFNFNTPVPHKNLESRELTKPFDVEFYVTDHTADRKIEGTRENFKKLYADIKKDGVNSVRYDWRWSTIGPAKNNTDEEVLRRYEDAMEVMHEVGLDEPTIILSNIPKWAVELYKKDKEEFFAEYQKYIDIVKNRLQEVSEKTGEKISKIQVLNELNNTVYTPLASEDVGRLVDMTRETFKTYNPDIKLLATFFAGNLPQVLKKIGINTGTEVRQYLKENKEILQKFDIYAIDNYPGTWHIPVGEAMENKKEMFKQLGLLEEVMREVASWGKEYELGEVGLPTNTPLFTREEDESRQRYFYDVFFREFKQLLLKLQKENIQLPTRVGLYESIDEPPTDIKGKILRAVTPFPEFDFGMRQGNGERKEILKGNRHVSDSERANSQSQLKNIIEYLNTPITKDDQ